MPTSGPNLTMQRPRAALNVQVGAGASRASRRRGSILVRLLPILFAAGLIAVVVAGLWNSANPSRGSAPEAIGAYQLSQIVTGPAAVTQMARLHGKGIGVVDGYVGHYEGPSGGIVAYVGEAASDSDAAALLKQMEQSIGTSNQYFTNLKTVTVNGVKLFSVRSGPENHYFWATGKKVIWLAFDKDDQTALAAAVTTIN